MDIIKRIRTRDDIFRYRVTASLLVSISDDITEDDRTFIRDNMGEVWIPYTYGRDSVTRDILKMPFYVFLLTYGDQGDIQGVKKYCSHSIDILNRDYNVYIGELFISRYGKDDPISKIIRMFIYDSSYYTIDDNNVITFKTTRGDIYKITPRVFNNIELITQNYPRRRIECNNGDIILKTGYCFFYNCVPLAYYEEYDDCIDIIDIDNNFHQLNFNDEGMIVSGYEDLTNEFRIRNDSIMDVYDIYRLLKLGMDSEILIRDYGFNYRVVRYLDSIDSIKVWQASTIVRYKDGHVNMENGMDLSVNLIHFDDGLYSIDYKGRTIMYVYKDFVNFTPIEYGNVMDLDGYAVLFNDPINVRILGRTHAN